MESATMTLGRIHILRVDPGEDLFESVQHFLGQAGVRQALILGGYGTLRLTIFTGHSHRIPSETAFGRATAASKSYERPGGRRQPHIHVALSTPDGALAAPAPAASPMSRARYFAEVEGKLWSRSRRSPSKAWAKAIRLTFD